MARPSVNDDAKTFLAALRKLKATVGNGFLRAQLDWRDERYWKAHSFLLEKGRIVRGRGRGGSVTAA
jgi:hypothetical protein